VLSVRGLCDDLNTRPEEFYRLWCVVVCDLGTTKILVKEEEAKAHLRAIAPGEKKSFMYLYIMQKNIQRLISPSKSSAPTNGHNTQFTSNIY